MDLKYSGIIDTENSYENISIPYEVNKRNENHQANQDEAQIENKRLKNEQKITRKSTMKRKNQQLYS